MIKRKIYNQILKTFTNKQIPIVMGLRRIGKTTSLEMIKKEFEKTLLITCDSFENLSMSDIAFYEFLKLKAEQNDILLIDEIQVRNNWDILLKNLFDQFVVKNKCKIVVTGSSSLILANKELGVNRTKRLIMETWDFDEYCKLTKKEKSFINFEKYLGYGGFPEYFKSDKNISEILNETIKPIIQNDINKAYPGTNTSNLLRFIKEISLLSNGEVNENSLSKKVLIDIRTARKYIDILNDCLLLKKVYRVDERGSLGKKRKYKVYLNPHVHIMLLNKDFSNLENKYKGHIIESYWLHFITSIVGYWNDFYYLKNKNNQEIDFVTLNNDGSFNQLHEFKYSQTFTKNDLELLYETKANRKIVWTKKTGNFEGIETISLLDIEDFKNSKLNI